MTTATEIKNPAPRAWRILIAYHGGPDYALARAAGVSPLHFGYVTRGERKPSQALLGRLREIIGAAAWAWATGACPELPLPESPAAAAVAP